MSDDEQINIMPTESEIRAKQMERVPRKYRTEAQPWGKKTLYSRPNTKAYEENYEQIDWSKKEDNNESEQDKQEDSTKSSKSRKTKHPKRAVQEEVRGDSNENSR